MPLDGVDREAEVRRDLAVRGAAGEESQHLDLSRRKVPPEGRGADDTRRLVAGPEDEGDQPIGDGIRRLEEQACRTTRQYFQMSAGNRRGELLRGREGNHLRVLPMEDENRAAQPSGGFGDVHAARLPHRLAGDRGAW